MSRRAAKPGFVLDASVSLAWHFPDESSDYATAVARALPTAGAVVPTLWRSEVANTLVVGERKKRTTAAEADAFLARLARYRIATDTETVARAWGETLALARKYLLTVYDASYLELAVRRGLPLASLDGPLKKAAVDAGVGLYEPPVGG